MEVRVGKPQEPPPPTEGGWTVETSAAIIKFTGGAADDFSGSESEPEDNAPTDNTTPKDNNQKDPTQSPLPNEVCQNGFDESDLPPKTKSESEQISEVQSVNASDENSDVPRTATPEGDSDNLKRSGENLGNSGQFSRERFNPFDRDMHMEENHYDTQDEQGGSVDNPGKVVDDSFSDDSFLSEPKEETEDCLVTKAELGLAEDHFSRPEGTFGMSTIEEIEMAIKNCKEMILESAESSDRRKNLVHKLIQLRIKLVEAKEGPVEEEEDVKVVVGHRFKKRESKGSEHYCEKCASVIWGVLHTWYKCTACGFCCHDKCLNLIYRTCAYVKVKENTNCILSICPQKGLDSQNYRCAECSTPISFIAGQEEPRRCDYTGAFYCRRCHWNDVMALPARVVHNWDLEPRKVCRASKQFLRLMAARACLRIQDINPMLFSLVEELNDVKKLREEILIMKRYFLSCQDALSSKLLLQLKDRQHFVENSDTYSLQDLMDVASDTLLPQLAKIHSSFAQHIKTDCQLCQAKGYLCELCDMNEVLFPFDNIAIVCDRCSTVLHRHCFLRRNRVCPKCERINKRAAILTEISVDESVET